MDLDLLATDAFSKDKSGAMDHLTMLRLHYSDQSGPDTLKLLRLECFGSILFRFTCEKKQSGAVRNIVT